MDIGQIVREGRLPRRHFLEAVALLGSSFLLSGCKTVYITEPDSDDPGNPENPGNPPSQTYNSITGLWKFKTRSDFSSSAFTGPLSMESLNLTQTSQIKEGYSQSSNVYKVTGNFSGLQWALQRKSNGILYPVFLSVSGSISNGGINTGVSAHNLAFYLGTGEDFSVRGVTSDYKSMWGDITARIDMTQLFRTSDGIVTLNGMWDATRK